MGTFTITQSESEGYTRDLFLLPSGAGCSTQLTPVGEVNNWECVNDPRVKADEDATYVFTKSPTVQYDVYNIPNHTTETGSINYVQLYGRAKSDNIAQHADSTFRLVLTDNACADVDKSESVNLTTVYATNNHVWLTNPRRGDDWTWTNIDSLQIGTEGSSVTVTKAELTEYYLPTGNGFYNQFDIIPAGSSAYTVVDDPLGSPDGSSTYIESPDLLNHRSTFTFTNTLVAGDNIEAVTVYGVLRGAGSQTTAICLTVRYAGNNYNGADIWMNAPTDWKTYSKTFTAAELGNPAMVGTDLTNLEFGVKDSMSFGHRSSIQCTQLYIKVDYNSVRNPEIRTTQCYAKVNYTSDPKTCTLDKPEEISVDHDQNVKMLNFWSGDRAVYGLSRNNRTMVLSGVIYSPTACDIVECIRNIADEGKTVLLSGLGSYNFDKKVRIISFGWKKMHDKPLAYEWILECEFKQ